MDSESASLVGGSSSAAVSRPPPPKVNKLRGVVCWGVFACFLLFFIIMTSVFTRPKEYQAARPQNYLEGEDLLLFDNLGNVTLAPKTISMKAYANFVLGLKMLHVFLYDQAMEKFQLARSQDPGMAMAYWGEAMCYKQPLWQTEDVAAAQAVLAQMDAKVALGSLPDKEKLYVAAVRQLFAPNTTLEQRERGYSTLMQALQDQFSDDPDACALAALSMLGQLQSAGYYLSDDETEQLRYAVSEMLDDCLHYYPRHPGLLHYNVYRWELAENPSDVVNGLPSAELLARVAPASNRAQHLRSHIALPMGNWSAMADSNVAAVAASDNYCAAVGAGNDCDAGNRWHALEWQLYGQVQQCAVGKATAAFARMQAVAASQFYAEAYTQRLYRMYAHLTLSSLNQGGAAPLGLMSPADNAATMLPRALTNFSTSNPYFLGYMGIEDRVWPSHDEAYALLARIFALSYNRTAAQQAAPGVQPTVAAALGRLAAITDLQFNLSSTQITAALSAAGLAPADGTPGPFDLLLANATAPADPWVMGPGDPVAIYNIMLAAGMNGTAAGFARVMNAGMSYFAAYGKEGDGGMYGAQLNLTDYYNVVAGYDIALVLTYVQLQANSLARASACSAGSTAAACAQWRPIMEAALGMRRNMVWINTGRRVAWLRIDSANELYGLLLLSTGTDPAAAASMFDSCLAMQPNRMPCVLGKARAAAAAGNRDDAVNWYRALLAQCKAGDAGFAPLVEARAAMPASPPPPSKGRGRRQLAL